MERTKSVVTPERFASGMTFDQYVAYVGTPENLKREALGGRGSTGARISARPTRRRGCTTHRSRRSNG